MNMKRMGELAGKLRFYNVVKGYRYLRHFGVKEFLIRLSERMEPEEVPYTEWYEAYKPTAEDLVRQSKVRWHEPVTFSIIVPVFRTPEKYLREMIESVQAQTYPYWQLCIVNADPADVQVAAVLAEFTAGDSRICVKDIAVNEGIAGNTNQGIEMASGDFICFLDHDDLLSPAVLFKVAEYLRDHADCDMVYTDEDKVDETGQVHSAPNLKPDFNPDLLRSNNYICHFLAVKKSLVDQTGPLRSGFDGAQDYDFVLRLSERAVHIGHVPEILYHWRTHAQSTADNPLSKEYAYEAGRRAIQEHLERCRVAGQAESLKSLGFYRVKYPVREKELVSIIIPNKDHADLLEKCLTSLKEKTSYDHYEVIIVENNSEEEETFRLYRQLEERHEVRVVTWKGQGFNYSALNNFGAQAAKGSYLICLNNDITVISPDWIQEMLGVCQREEVGVVGARLYYPDETYQHAGIIMGIGGVAGSMFVDMKRGKTGYLHKAALLQDLSAVTAACMMVKRSAWEKVGGFNEKLAVAFNDVDFCLCIRREGYLVVYDPYVEMYHDESKSRGTEDSEEKVRRFQTEIEYMRSHWLEYLKEGDPYYNKNLSRTKWNYSLRIGEHME